MAEPQLVTSIRQKYSDRHGQKNSCLRNVCKNHFLSYFLNVFEVFKVFIPGNFQTTGYGLAIVGQYF